MVWKHLVCGTLLLVVYQVPSAVAAQDGRPVHVETHAVAGLSSVQVLVFAPARRADAAVVFLHGVGGSDASWENLDGPAVLQSLERQSGPAVAVVAVAGDSLGWPEHRDGSVSWETFLLEELPAYLRSEFGSQISPSRIAYMGVSAGGVKALAMAFRRPSDLRCIAAHSPAIQPDDPADLPAWAAGWEGWRPLYGLPIELDIWQAYNPIHLASQVPADSLRTLRMYFDVGAEDHLGFQVTSGQLSAALAARGVPHIFAVREGGHGSEFNRANLPRSLRFLIECLGDQMP